VWRRQYTRRDFVVGAGKAGAAGAVAQVLPLSAFAPPAAAKAALSRTERRTLRAAVARIVPAEHPGDWSAADVGAHNYVLNLLAGIEKIYAGGPVRRRFPRFQRMWRVKRIGWRRYVRKMRGVYRSGLADLDRRAGGDFAVLPGPAQDAILLTLDLEGTPFFRALYNHTLEGVYSHPVYGGNGDYRAWRTFAYAGDVHGVRFPGIGPADAPWNEYGGYAPQEMIEPGKGP
jgi:gluconate 2-dehydrogenase subunit 3-like protein